MTTILAIEDQTDLRTLLRVVLERAGHRLLEAVDGRSGLRAFHEHHPADPCGASPADPLRPCDPTRTQVDGSGHGVRERGTGAKVERHLRWLVSGTGRHGAERPFNESDLHLDRGEQRQYIGLG